MAQKFGNTWWGRAWLDALSHIDYANRIPRGASYARNGYVSDVSIFGDGVIYATVRGSRPRPYAVKLSMTPFDKGEKEAFIKGIMANPIVISKLLNHELDPLVLAIADKVGVRVFPNSWNSLRMICNCPDYAVPCKHIAAVIYVLSREIDNNPFVLFKMRGLDIMEELKSRGLKVENETVSVPSVSSVVAVDTDNSDVVRSLELPDLSSLENLADTIVGLLPKEPVFCDKGDFQNLYASALTRARKAVDRLMGHRVSAAEFFDCETEVQLTKSSKLRLTLTKDLVYQVGIAEKKRYVRIDFWAMMLLLLRIPADFSTECHESVQAFRIALICALNALSKGLVSPQVVSLPSGKFAVRWLAATVYPKMRDAVKQLNDGFPVGVVRFDEGKSGSVYNTLGEEAVSAFLTEIIKHKSAANNVGNKVYDMFFRGMAQTFDDSGEREVPGNVKSWTDHLYATTRRWRPMLIVEESVSGEWFRMSLSVTDTESPEGKSIKLKSMFSNAKYKNVRFDVLKDLTSLSQLIPGLENYINNKAMLAMRMSVGDFADFLTQVIPAMRLIGVDVALPKSLNELIRPRPTVRIGVKKSVEKSFVRLDQMLDFNWEIAIGKDIVSVDEFNAMKENAGKLLKFKQHYVYMGPDDLAHLQKVMSAKDVPSGKLLQAALSEEYGSSELDVDNTVKEKLRGLRQWSDIAVPGAVNAELRPYQQRGFSWLYNMMQLGFGAILADDMGLGKTLQTITLIQKLKDDGALICKKVLVVVPMGLMSNWQAELQRFAPQLSVFVYHGLNRNIDDFKEDVLITSYGTMRSDVDSLKKKKWRVMIIDEAQNIKNNSAMQTKAVKSVSADWRLALSGTPVENRLSEFWSIMDFVNKGYLGSETAFAKEYARPIQVFGDGVCAKRFRKVTAPMMLRRLKTDKSIIADLPDKIEKNEYAALTPDQASIYQNIVEESMKLIEDVNVVDKETLFKRQGLVLQMMLALKQVCNHPTQYLKNGKLDPALSGKTEMLLDLLSIIADNGEKTLVFTQFKEMGDLLVGFIEESTGQKPMFLHGGLNADRRKEMVERFQTDRSERVLILSLKAAGTGLNLTAASHVIHYDLWWNPAVEAQATDRAYRIGQNKNVIVHRFITKGTFEERIDDMIQSKRGLADMTVASGENWIGKLSNAELRDLFE